jgi:hypothetical protein
MSDKIITFSTSDNNWGLQTEFFIARCEKAARVPPVRIKIKALTLAGLGLGLWTGCITAGGKPVNGLPANVEAKEGAQLTAVKIANRLRDAEKARETKTEAGEVFTFDRDIVIENFDSKGKLERRQTRRFRSFSDNRIPVLLLHDGKPPTPEQVEKERKKIVEHKLKFLGGGKPEELDAKGDANLLVRQIELYGDHFTPRLIGAETVEGRPAYILQFLLNPENRFKDSLVNTIMKHLLIKVWIDKEEFQIAKLEAELVNPLYVLGGLAGKVISFKLTAFQKRLTPEIWADWKVTAHIHGRLLWETHIIRFTSESSEFKPLPKTE